MTTAAGAAPDDDLTIRALTVLRQEVDRMFAQHDALAAATRRRGAERSAALREAAEKEKAAYTAAERAWGAWAAARDQLRQRPGDLTALAAADQAEAGYDTARETAHALHTAVSALVHRLLDDSDRETRQLLELGRRARATQDAWIEATLGQTPGPAS